MGRGGAPEEGLSGGPPWELWLSEKWVGLAVVGAWGLRRGRGGVAAPDAKRLPSRGGAGCGPRRVEALSARPAAAGRRPMLSGARLAHKGEAVQDRLADSRTNAAGWRATGGAAAECGAPAGAVSRLAKLCEVRAWSAGGASGRMRRAGGAWRRRIGAAGDRLSQNGRMDTGGGGLML